jgi:hypothetical protein
LSFVCADAAPAATIATDASTPTINLDNLRMVSPR